MSTAPTSLRGYATDDMYAGILLDALEHVPDLQYPLSVPVYGKMRHETSLTAVLSSYTLPIRRASWVVNPAGCRPEVVQLVADDLGLPVMGKDEPGAARTRGVSWAEHLRTALGYLTFGHAGHELLAEMRDGKARLAGLYERVQSTIQEIHVDRQGNLLGISQELRAKANSPQVKADRLVWYVHEREGANLAGRSLLRSAYGPWLIKQDLMRTHAVSNKRWGAGVPVMEALPGTAPSPGQMAEAMQMAAAARAGDQAGAATPPGFVMKILGMSGSVPDTLSFIKYCDASMSRMALAGFLDLGSGDTGSYALAKSFVDLFLLNIQTIADHVADTVTRQVAARIVEWNWGDEPVPAVQVSDIGSRHELTAEALNLLLGSGALSADPGLEAQVRRMYQLPERVEPEGRPAPSGRVFEHDLNSGVITKNERRAQIGLPPVEGGDELAEAQPTTPPPATKRKPKPQADGQLELDVAASTSPPAVGVARRDRPSGRVAVGASAEGSARPRRHEAAAGDDDDGSQAAWTAAVAGLLATWPALAAPLVDELVVQAEAAVASGDVAGLGTLAASAATVDALAATLTVAMTTLADTAAQQVVASAAAQGVTVNQPEPDQTPIAGLAAATAAWIASGYATAAARRAVLAPAGQVAAAVRTALTDMSTAERGMVADHVGAALSTAQGQGRLAVLAANPARGYRADESNDKAACVACRTANGRTYPTLAAALVDYPNGVQNARCEGGARCRGHLEPIWT